MASNYAYKYTPTEQMGLQVDKMVSMVSTMRKNFERRWYDNNFFDDGHHFRYLSRTTGKIIDISDQSSSNLPMRAIPKASRQIRGIANLLSSLEPTPVVYPEKISQANYGDEAEYLAAAEIAKLTAQKTGLWLGEEFKNQRIKEKLIEMIVLAAKHGVSFMQIWPDSVDEKIRTEVFDAFDIWLMGNMTSIYDCPFIIKGSRELISRIKANENFDEAQLDKISADNKYASSEIKEAYMQSRYGAGQEADNAETLIQKEAFVKEYLNDENYDDCKKLSEKTGAMEGKKKGDQLIRHTFSAGGVWLLDEYIALPEYPFVDFRFEPGPIYQTPLIERFIPANKSLDIAMSRIERWMNTMVSGTWVKRKGEDLTITNLPGGQVLEYAQTPPVQGQMANVPAGAFEFMAMLERQIEEQGASTSALGRLPEGVRSGVAIESIKSTEFDNLKIASDMYRDTVKRIAERFLDIADGYFIDPQSVYMLEQGEPKYFDIIGMRGLEARQMVASQMGERYELPPNTYVINGEYRVNIEVESGLGYTMQGKKETMQQIVQFMISMAQQGLLSSEAVKVVVKKMLETYQFGATQEFMEAMDKGTQTMPLSEDQISQMKVAVAETLKDIGLDQKLVDSTKLGVAEAIKDLQGGANATQNSSNGPIQR